MISRRRLKLNGLAGRDAHPGEVSFSTFHTCIRDVGNFDQTVSSVCSRARRLERRAGHVTRAQLLAKISLAHSAAK